MYNGTLDKPLASFSYVILSSKNYWDSGWQIKIKRQKCNLLFIDKLAVLVVVVIGITMSMVKCNIMYVPMHLIYIVSESLSKE